MSITCCLSFRSREIFTSGYSTPKKWQYFFSPKGGGSFAGPLDREIGIFTSGYSTLGFSIALHPPPFSVFSIWGMRVKFCLKGGGGATTKYGRKSNQPALDLDTITTSPISHDTLPCPLLIRESRKHFLNQKISSIFYLSQTFDWQFSNPLFQNNESINVPLCQ